MQVRASACRQLPVWQAERERVTKRYSKREREEGGSKRRGERQVERKRGEKGDEETGVPSCIRWK